MVVDVVVNSQVLVLGLSSMSQSQQASSSTTRWGRQYSQIIQRISRGNRGKKGNTWSASSASCGRGEAMDHCWERWGSETDQAERQARN